MPLKVLTLNLWHDSGPYARRAARIREWIRRLDPDLVGFQEALRVRRGDQVEELLDGLGYHLDYVTASSFWRVDDDGATGDVGNAVASRWPIVDREELRLPESGDGETRAALSVTLDAPVGPVGFTVTHLNWKLDQGAVRERQVMALADMVLRRTPERGFPPVLVGDLNAEPESSEVRFLTGHQSLGGRSVCFIDAWARAGDGDSGVTWSNRNPYAVDAREPDRRIDYVLVGLSRRDGLGQVLSCRVVCDDEAEGVWPTDHFGVFAELRSEPVARRARG